MKAPFYIISDNHFMTSDSVYEKERRNKLFLVLDLICSKGKGTLIIGGDFFDFWFENNKVIPNGYQNLIIALKKVNDAGIKIHYIAGNHDYWDFGYLNKTANITFHKGDLEFSCNNKNVLITHGDGLLKNDYGYRFMKSIIRSSIFIRLFKIIPPSISFKWAKKLSRSSSSYNHNDSKVDMIISDVLEYAKEKWLSNKNIIMVGHYHQLKIINKNNNSLVFLGDWLRHFSVTTLSEEGLWQGDYKEFIKLA